MYQLYTIPGSCSTGIHILLNAMQLSFEMIKRDDVDNYASMVPTNQVPALKTDNNLLTEGAAIVIHLLNSHGQQSLINDQEFIRWLMFNYATLHPAYSKLFSLNGLLEDGETKQQLMQQFGDRVAALWQIVDRHLQERDFMHGDQASIIDYLLTIYVRWGNVFPTVKIPVGNNVLDLVARVSVLPEVEQAFIREEVAYSIPGNAQAA